MTQPTPSNILITLIPGDSNLWPGLEVDDLAFDGESAEFEHEASVLEDAIASVAEITKPGIYYIWGFQATYTKDYYGEVDVDHEIAGWREATVEDLNSIKGVPT